MKAKTQYAASVGLGGVFFWEGGQDAADESVSLMAAARAAAEAASNNDWSKADLDHWMDSRTHRVFAVELYMSKMASSRAKAGNRMKIKRIHSFCSAPKLLNCRSTNTLASERDAAGFFALHSANFCHGSAHVPPVAALS